MSLINDALRRAKQAQQDAPPREATPVTHFKPVEPAIQSAPRGPGVLLPVSLALVALLAVLLLWQLSRKDSSSAPAAGNAALSVAARAPVTPSDTPTVPAGTPAVSNPRPVKPGVANAPEVAPGAPEHITKTAFANSSTTSNANLTPVVSETGDTNHAVANEPTPAPLKLQGIVYNPHRPSAMINGRVVFLGDRIRDLKVTAIHPSDVLLTGAGRTNLLSLEP